MCRKYPKAWSRREFLVAVTLAGSSAVLGQAISAVAPEPPPETKRLRLLQSPSICWAPQYMAEELLQREGFTDVQYVKSKGGEEGERMLSLGQVDISMGFSARHVLRIEAGDPTVVLSGLHIGCFELFTTDKVRSIRELKGKSVAVTQLGSGRHVFFASMMAYVGLDPAKDIRYVTDPAPKSMRLFVDGTIDAFMAFAPEPQELRAKNIGHVLADSMADKPWSQYFCCLVVANRQFVQNYPVATKRALRAILMANDLTEREPERAARRLLDKGVTDSYKYALQYFKGSHYGQWSEYDAEDTLRFYALRLYDAGMIKSPPQRIIAQGADWRFLRELKKEMKG